MKDLYYTARALYSDTWRKVEQTTIQQEETCRQKHHLDRTIHPIVIDPTDDSDIDDFSDIDLPLDPEQTDQTETLITDTHTDPPLPDYLDSDSDIDILTIEE